jgi:hypothetical protein
MRSLPGLHAQDIFLTGGHREGVSTGQLVPGGKEVGNHEDAPLAKGVSILDNAEGEGRVLHGGHVTSGSQRGEGTGDIILQVVAGDEGIPDTGLKGGELSDGELQEGVEVDTLLPRGVSGGKEEIHVSPVLPGQIEGQADEVTHELGIIGKLTFLEQWAVHTTQHKGSRQDRERGVGESAADESTDGVADLVKQGAGDAVAVHEIGAAGEEEGFGKDHAIVSGCAYGIPLLNYLLDVGVDLVPTGSGNTQGPHAQWQARASLESSQNWLGPTCSI